MGRDAAETRRELTALRVEVEAGVEDVRAALDEIGRELARQPWLALAIALPLALFGLAVAGRRGGRPGSGRALAGATLPLALGAGLVLVAQRALRARQAAGGRTP